MTLRDRLNQVLVWIRRALSQEGRGRLERTFLTVARATTVGVAYVVASPIPGLTSSFVAIFTALLPFDLFVAQSRPPLRAKDWEQFLAVLKPRVLSTASTLGKGVLVGMIFGLLAQLGLPAALGAVLTTGMAYVWALGTRHAISVYVSIISGLTLFDRLYKLEALETDSIVVELLQAIASTGGGTFAALIVGWGVGLVAGIVTRSLLSRPYRSVRSAAYDLPLEMRPFNEVMHVGERSLVVSAKVEEGSPVAHLSLAESDLRKSWGSTVLSIKRDRDEIVMPSGSDVLSPGDEVIMLTERDRAALVFERFRAPEPGAESEAVDSREDAEGV